MKKKIIVCLAIAQFSMAREVIKVPEIQVDPGEYEFLAKVDVSASKLDHIQDGYSCMYKKPKKDGRVHIVHCYPTSSFRKPEVFPALYITCGDNEPGEQFIGIFENPNKTGAPYCSIWANKPASIQFSGPEIPDFLK